ncbi:MAG: ABC transporter substrate-binding protein [Proteobacteria bacterium]|nr:ABC transporter substrate-binding protein [Pseudomonadota bacterium]
MSKTKLPSTIDNQALLLKDAATMTRRQFIGSATAAGIALPLAASVFSDVQAQTPKKGGLMRLAIDGGSTGDSLDPALCTNNTCGIILKQWGDTLTRVTPEGKVIGRIAESFEVADGKGAKWHFRLRQGINFHNGQSLTSADVVDTLRRHSDENSKSGALGIMRSITDIAADGKYGVLITLDSANADFPYLLSDYHLVVQPAGSKGDSAVGCGPYIMKEVEHGVRYLVERDPNFYLSPGYADQIETLVVNDTTARITALTTGDVHMISRVDPKLAGRLNGVNGVTVQNVSGRGHYVFVCHTNTAPFDNVDLRLALKYAINREEMVKRILHGYGGLGNDFPINAAYPLFAKDIPQRTYDMDKAKFHYKKSGHSGPVVLRTADAAFPGAVDAAVLFQNHAKAAGINLEVKREPNDGYWSSVWNAQPFCASYWSGRPVQDQMYSTAYKSDADWNDTKWKNPKFDTLLLQARGELDETKRRSLYKELAYLVRDDGGAIIPMFNDWVDATRGIGGYVKDPNLKLSNDYAPVEAWLTE